MSRYTADSRDRVREAVDMVVLVSSKVELRRAGVNSYFGRCPFHDERTASFHVSPDEKLYHCFGCSESGDPFDFVMQTEGLDFKGALEALAERFGIRLETEHEDPEAAARRQRRERLYSLVRRAAVYYSRYLWEAQEAAEARAYLLGRGFTEEVLRSFGVGYAPSAWDRILLASRRAGYSDEELLAAGLVRRSHNRPGSVYDFFRRQIMFPTADRRGRVLGFGGRAMGDVRDRPKYVNTPDGELYHKRAVLYGVDLARPSAARAGRMVVVEGYTDVIALRQAGVTEAVGIMGTSLTVEQVRELETIAPVVELCLDADPAGQQAMLRSAEVAAGSRLELRVVQLPAGRDPGDLLAAEGAEALRDRVQRSVPFVVFHVERILERSDLSSAEGRDAAFAELQPVLGQLRVSGVRDELTRRISGALELSETRLARLLAGGDASTLPARRQVSAQPTPTVDDAVRTERAFLAMCIALPRHGGELLERVDPEQLLTSAVLRRAARHLTGRTTAPLADLPAGDDELARAVADLVDRAGRGGEPSEAALEHARLLLELARIDRALARKRAQREPGVGDLAREKQELLAALRSVGSRLEGPV